MGRGVPLLTLAYQVGWGCIVSSISGMKTDFGEFCNMALLHYFNFAMLLHEIVCYVLAKPISVSQMHYQMNYINDRVSD